MTADTKQPEGAPSDAVPLPVPAWTPMRQTAGYAYDDENMRDYAARFAVHASGAMLAERDSLAGQVRQLAGAHLAALDARDAARRELERLRQPTVSLRSCAKHEGQPWSMTATVWSPARVVCPLCEPDWQADRPIPSAAGPAREGREPQCEWTLDSDPDVSIWNSSCGEAWTFTNDGPIENSVRFCHGCGKAVKLAGTSADGETQP